MPNQNFNFHISTIYFIGSLLLFTASLAIVLLQPLNLQIKLVLSLCVIFYGVHIFFRFIFLQSKKSVLRLSYYEKQWYVQTNRASYLVHILGDSLSTRVFSVIRMQIADTNHKLIAIIFLDSLPKKEYRQLRVKLMSAC